MTAFMVVAMDIGDEGWIAPYFDAVPAILASHGGRQIAGARDVRLIEGTGTVPDRVALFTFPSIAAIECFMADDRYEPFLRARRDGSSSEILIFENAVGSDRLV